VTGNRVEIGSRIADGFVIGDAQQPQKYLLNQVIHVRAGMSHAHREKATQRATMVFFHGRNELATAFCIQGILWACAGPTAIERWAEAKGNRREKKIAPTLASRSRLQQ
jgi:hypothetical protein